MAEFPQRAEEDLVAAVLLLPAGYSVELFGLHVARLEDGRFTVFEHGHPGETIFDTVDDAARAFVALRKKNELGFDFETCRTSTVNGGGEG